MPKLPFALNRRSFLLSSAAGFLAGPLAARADQEANDKAGDVFPLLNCPVCETELGGTDQIIREENRELRACDQECVEELQADYFNFLDAIDEQILLEQKDDYPLDKCLVDGTSLEGKDPLDFVFRNRVFRVCCEDCRYEIEDQPAKYFAQLNAAVAKKQKAGYPLETCLVSKKPLGPKAIDHVCANMLVRLADPDQILRFNESPGKHLEELRKLREQKASSKG